METSTWYAKFPSYKVQIEAHIERIKKRKHTLDVPNKDELPNDGLEVTIVGDAIKYSGKIKLKEILARLQYLAHYNEQLEDVKPRQKFIINILGNDIVFYLRESTFSNGKKRGRQICIYDENKEMSKYTEIMPDLEKYDGKKLANSILMACETSLDDQQAWDLAGNDQMIKKASLFIILTHIAEAAMPFQEALNEFESAAMQFQKAEKKLKSFSSKTGRIPLMDKIVRAKLQKVKKGASFGDEFGKEKFPIQDEHGTQKARDRLLEEKETDVLSDDEVEELTKLLQTKGNI